MKASERLEALERAGIKTDGMIAVQGASQNGTLAAISRNILLSDSFDQVIPVKRLYRRWVLSQMFRYLKELAKYRYDISGSIKDGNCYYPQSLIAEKGVSYMMRTLEEEFRVQDILYKKDFDAYCERNKWINSKTVQSAYEYCLFHINFHKLLYVDKIGESALNDNVALLKKIIEFCGCDLTPDKILESFVLYKKELAYLFKRVKWCYCNKWLNDFTKAGAYFSIKNLILFHGCSFKGLKDNGAVELLETYDNTNDMMRELNIVLAENNIDIYAKTKEWYMAKITKRG